MDLSAIDQELDKLKTQLADLSSRYKERIPGDPYVETSDCRDGKDEGPASRGA